MRYKLDGNYNKLIRASGIDILGNLDSGIIIGLNEEGKEFAEKLLYEGIEEEQIRTELQKNMLAVMESKGFFTDDLRRKLQSVYLHVTDRCNMNCQGCYSGYMREENAFELSFDEIKDILTNVKRAGADSIIISGGEPFLRDDIIEIFRLIKKELGFSRLTCITNGTASRERYKMALQYVDQLKYLCGGCAFRGYSRRNQLKDKDTFCVISKESIHTTISALVK